MHFMLFLGINRNQSSVFALLVDPQLREQEAAQCQGRNLCVVRWGMLRTPRLEAAKEGQPE